MAWEAGTIWKLFLKALRLHVLKLNALSELLQKSNCQNAVHKREREQRSCFGTAEPRPQHVEFSKVPPEAQDVSTSLKDISSHIQFPTIVQMFTTHLHENNSHDLRVYTSYLHARCFLQLPDDWDINLWQLKRLKCWHTEAPFAWDPIYAIAPDVTTLFVLPLCMLNLSPRHCTSAHRVSM